MRLEACLMLAKSLKRNGAIERIRTSDLCLRRATPINPQLILQRASVAMQNLTTTHDRDEVCHCGWRNAGIYNLVNYDAVTNNHVSLVIVRDKRNV